MAQHRYFCSYCNKESLSHTLTTEISPPLYEESIPPKFSRSTRTNKKKSKGELERELVDTYSVPGRTEAKEKPSLHVKKQPIRKIIAISIILSVIIASFSYYYTSLEKESNFSIDDIPKSFLVLIDRLSKIFRPSEPTPESSPSPTVPTIEPTSTLEPTSSPEPTTTQEPTSTPEPTSTIEPEQSEDAITLPPAENVFFISTYESVYRVGEILNIYGQANPNVTVNIHIFDPANSRVEMIKTITDDRGRYSFEDAYIFLENDLRGEWMVEANWLYHGGQFTRAKFVLTEEAQSVETPISTPTSSPAATPTIPDVRDIELAILKYTNLERTKNGLKELVWDEKLSEIAREHSEDMALNQYYSHINLKGEDPTDRAERHGYDTRKELGDGTYQLGIGENIGGMPTGHVLEIGYVSNNADSIAKAQVKSWMNSIGHRENILDPYYDRIGVGVAYDGLYYISTQNFW